jgi:autotransporter-associated beta strand protein
MVSRARSLSRLALHWGALTAVASAQTYVGWNGLGRDDLWRTADNWVGGIAPASDGTLTPQFGVSARTNVVVDAPWRVAGLRFDYPVTNDLTYRLNGSAGPLTLGAGGLVTTNAATVVPPDPGTVTSATPGTVTFQPSLPLVLADSQTWSLATGTAAIVSGNVTGAARLTLAGPGLVTLAGNNTYSGGTDLAGGTLALGSDSALGSGPLTVSGPARIFSPSTSRTLTNSVLLHAAALVLEAYAGEILFNGRVTLGTSTTLSSTGARTVFGGDIGESGGARSVTITGPGGVEMAGVNTYSGGTQVKSSALFFRHHGSVPAAGNLSVDALGYIGAGFTKDTAAGFISRFSPPDTTGTIGFDTDPTATSANVITEPVDLSAFSVLARLGSATRATLAASATLTPAKSTGYRFGGGGGTLRVESLLTGAGTTVTADSSQGTELTVYLTYTDGRGGGNDYTGETSATHSAIVFGPSSAPAATYLLGSGGYIGTQDTTLAPATWLKRFDSAATTGIIGWDTEDPNRPHVVGGPSEPIDLSQFTARGPSIALGTTSVATLAGAITLPADQADYHFAGYKGGLLTVATTLSGRSGVHIGDALGDYPDLDRNDPKTLSAVSLATANKHAGGTTLHSGRLGLDDPDALGSGPLTISRHARATTPRVDTALTSKPSFGNALQVASGFELGGANTFTWAGDVSDHGGTGTLWKYGPATVAFSGDNRGFSGGFHVGEGTLTFTTDTAAGTGGLDFGSTGTVTAMFMSAAPAIGSLGAGSASARLDLAQGTTLTLNQTTAATFLGQIEGPGGFVKSGPSRLTLSTPSTYTGGTRITAGRLGVAASGALGSGAVTLDGPTADLNLSNAAVVANAVSFGAGGGTLSGTGTFGSQVSVGAGSTLAPGNPVGALTFATGLAWAGGGAYRVDVQNATGTPGTGWDHLQVTGNLTFSATLGSPFTVHLRSLDGNGQVGSTQNFDPYAAYAWTILSATALNGFNAAAVTLDTSGFTTSVNGGTFSLTHTGNTLAVAFTPVPEPETWALLGIGLGAAAWMQWRRRRN